MRHPASFLAILMLCACALQSPLGHAQDAVPKDIVGSDFALPIMKDGERSMLVRGKTVKSFGGTVNLDGLQIQLFPTKKMNATVMIFSPKASYDTAEQSAASKERVNVRALHPAEGLEKGQMQYQTVVDGVGFDFFNGKRSLGIRSKVVAHMQPVEKDDAKAGDRTKITAKRLDYQFERQPGTITFFDDVDGTFTSVRKDAKTGAPSIDEFHLSADKLVIEQGGTQSIDTFEANGKVTIVQRKGGTMVASGDKAVCSYADGEVKAPKDGKTTKIKTRIIRLTGKPVLTTPEGKLTGAEEVVIKKTGDLPIEAFTIGGRPKMVFLSESDRKLLPEFGSPARKPVPDAPDGTSPKDVKVPVAPSPPSQP